MPNGVAQNFQNDERLTGFRNGNITPLNNGKCWTDDDRKRLKIMYDLNVGITQMALDLERTELAIVQQAVQMGLITPPAASARAKKKKTCSCICSKCLNFECEKNPNSPMNNK